MKGLNLVIGLVFRETGRIFTIFAVILSASKQKKPVDEQWTTSSAAEERAQRRMRTLFADSTFVAWEADSRRDTFGLALRAGRGS